MYKKLTNCKYCNITFTDFTTPERANHSRWCALNPKRPEYVNINSGKHLASAETIKKRTEGIKKAWRDGKYDRVNRSHSGYKHTDKTKELLREKALASSHRRLVRSIREYTKKDGTIVKLDSSWEEILATRLDQINVDWVRPDPIKWVDKLGVWHHYFPDFYLPEYDVYLDPKGPYAVAVQRDKIICLTEQIKNLIIITSLADCENFTPLTKI